MANITFTRAIPVLASLDLAKTEAWYQEKLGFKTGGIYDNYLILYRDNFVLHFWLTTDKAFPENTSCYVDVEGVDALYAECEAADIVHPNGPLRDQPYGQREFAILDNDGNMIRFGEPISEASD